MPGYREVLNKETRLTPEQKNNGDMSACQKITYRYSKKSMWSDLIKLLQRTSHFHSFLNGVGSQIKSVDLADIEENPVELLNLCPHVEAYIAQL